MPYPEHEKKIYNRGFYSGARYMVMRVIAYINGYDDVKCFKCPETLRSNLEIHDKVRPDKRGENNNNRNFDDWVLIDNLEILCKECHAQTDGYRGRNGNYDME